MLRLRPDYGSQERVRPSQPSLDFLACVHVFNNFWGYPGKTPNYRHLLLSLDRRLRPTAFRPPGAWDKVSHLSIFAPVLTFSATSGVIPAKRLTNVTLCLPSIADCDQPHRVQAAGSMRQSRPSLYSVPCTHVFNNFCGYPGKAPSYCYLLPSLDYR